jgi:hypothetical protein
MPATPKAQQRAAGAALAAKGGAQTSGELQGAAKSVYGSLNKRQPETPAAAVRQDTPQRAPA